MATYYTNPNNQRDGAPMFYTRENTNNSYPDTSVIPSNMTMYMNSGSFSDSLTGNSQQTNTREMISMQGHQEILSMFGGSRIGEHDYNAWNGASSGMLEGQALSLSLSNQIPPFPYRDHNQDEQSRNVEYFPPNGFLGGNQEDLSSSYAMPGAARNISGSKYLKAAQQLLDEVVNVRKGLKQGENERNEQLEKSSKDGDEAGSEAPLNRQESISSAPCELSHAERQDLQNKLTKLLSMLDEVDRRYKQYYHQMQIVVSSFDAIAGCGAAKPYTALALQTISRHFRCLRDAIANQIRAARKGLGDQDTSGNGKGVGISRLRFVDQQLRQQRALQQLGMMQQHAWRPQRGLPESSVSILRAWLFEHFLHPYPKDSDKIMLARQTGLTRSQVSNWFINARVRLWKPMVEEMYKEEAGDAEMESNSSSDNLGRASKGDAKIPEDTSSPDHAPKIETAGEAHFYPASMAQQPDGCHDGLMEAAYRIPGGSGSGVSLTLGLQHCDGETLPPMSGGSHHGFNDDIFSAFGRARGDGDGVR